jgi:hypothetical protein
MAACRLALAQDDRLALGYGEDAVAVVRLEARGQALELGQGRSSQRPCRRCTLVGVPWLLIAVGRSPARTSGIRARTCC